MKNLLKIASLLLFIFIASPSQSMTVSNPLSSAAAKPVDAAEMSRLTNRLEEINAMDKESLSRPERKELRKEVKSIKKTMDGGGVYISIGGLLLIIILLIILL